MKWSIKIGKFIGIDVYIMLPLFCLLDGLIWCTGSVVKVSAS